MEKLKGDFCFANSVLKKKGISSYGINHGVLIQDGWLYSSVIYPFKILKKTLC